LIARADGDLVAEVAGAHVLRAREQVVHRAGDLPRQHEADHERDELDDQEQPAHHRQERQQHLSEVHLPDTGRGRREPLVDGPRVDAHRQRRAEAVPVDQST
jgi:hypothetical protein